MLAATETDICEILIVGLKLYIQLLDSWVQHWLAYSLKATTSFRHL